MGRSLMEMCKFVKCLPSELYVKHDPTIGDFLAVSAYWRIIQEEEMAKKIAEILVFAEEKEDLKDYTKSALTTYSEIIDLLYSANKPMTKEELIIL